MLLGMKYVIRNLRRSSCSKSNRRKRQASYVSAIEGLEKRTLLSAVAGVSSIDDAGSQVSDSNLETSLETGETYQEVQRLELHGDGDNVLIDNDGQAPAPANGAAEAVRSVRIERLIEELGSGKYKTRQQASAELETIGRPAVPFLIDALQSGDDEVVERARKTLQQIAFPEGNEGLFTKMLQQPSLGGATAANEMPFWGQGFVGIEVAKILEGRPQDPSAWNADDWRRHFEIDSDPAEDAPSENDQAPADSNDSSDSDTPNDVGDAVEEVADDVGDAAEVVVKDVGDAAEEGADDDSPRSVIEMATPQARSAGTLSGLRAPGSPLLVDPTAPPVGAVGVLVRVRDRNGNQVRIGRIPADDPKRPRAISELEDDLSRTTTFTYSNLPGQEDLVEKIEQFQGAGTKRDWRFEYDSQRSLIKVSSPPSDWLDEAGVLRVHKSKQPVANLLALEDGNQQPANKNPNKAAQPETLEELRKRRAELELQHQKAERQQGEFDQTGEEGAVDQQELARSLEEQQQLRDEMRELDQKILEQLKKQHAEKQDELNRRAEEILVEEFGEGDLEIPPHELKRLEETNPEFKVLVQDVHELEELEKQIADLESQNAVNGRDTEDKKQGEQEKQDKPNLSESQKREISRCLGISMYDVEKLLEEGELDLDSASRNIESLGNDRIIDFNRLLFPGTDKQEERGTLQIFFPPEQSHDTGQSADEEKDNDGTADNTDDDEQSADSGSPAAEDPPENHDDHEESNNSQDADEPSDSTDSSESSQSQEQKGKTSEEKGKAKKNSAVPRGREANSGRERGLLRSRKTNPLLDERKDQHGEGDDENKPKIDNDKPAAENNAEPKTSGFQAAIDSINNTAERVIQQIADSATDEQIQQWIEMLGHEDWSTRELASKWLSNVGERAVPFLYKALQGDNPEIQHRAKVALDAIIVNRAQATLDQLNDVLDQIKSLREEHGLLDMQHLVLPPALFQGGLKKTEERDQRVLDQIEEREWQASDLEDKLYDDFGMDEEGNFIGSTKKIIPGLFDMSPADSGSPAAEDPPENHDDHEESDNSQDADEPSDSTDSSESSQSQEQKGKTSEKKGKAKKNSAVPRGREANSGRERGLLRSRKTNPLLDDRKDQHGEGDDENKPNGDRGAEDSHSVTKKVGDQGTVTITSDKPISEAVGAIRDEATRDLIDQLLNSGDDSTDSQPATEGVTLQVKITLILTDPETQETIRLTIDIRVIGKPSDLLDSILKDVEESKREEILAWLTENPFLNLDQVAESGEPLNVFVTGALKSLANAAIRGDGSVDLEIEEIVVGPLTPSTEDDSPAAEDPPEEHDDHEESDNGQDSDQPADSNDSSDSDTPNDSRIDSGEKTSGQLDTGDNNSQQPVDSSLGQEDGNQPPVPKNPGNGAQPETLEELPADETNDDDSAADSLDDDEQSAGVEWEVTPLSDQLTILRPERFGESRQTTRVCLPVQWPEGFSFLEPDLFHGDDDDSAADSSHDDEQSAGVEWEVAPFSDQLVILEPDLFHSDGGDEWLEERGAGENLFRMDDPPNLTGQNGEEQEEQEEQERTAGLKTPVDAPNQRSGQNMRFEDGSRLNISEINQVFSNFGEVADACLLEANDPVSQNDDLKQLPKSEVAMMSPDEDDVGFAVPLYPVRMVGASVVPLGMLPQPFPPPPPPPAPEPFPPVLSGMKSAQMAGQLRICRFQLEELIQNGKLKSGNRLFFVFHLPDGTWGINVFEPQRRSSAEQAQDESDANRRDSDGLQRDGQSRLNQAGRSDKVASADPQGTQSDRSHESANQPQDAAKFGTPQEPDPQASGHKADPARIGAK